jgi:hypothetical protein
MMDGKFLWWGGRPVTVLWLGVLAMVGCVLNSAGLRQAQPAAAGLPAIEVRPTVMGVGWSGRASTGSAGGAATRRLETVVAPATWTPEPMPTTVQQTETAVPPTLSPAEEIAALRLLSVTATPTPTPVVINGLLPDTFVVLPPEVIAHSRQIFAKGQAMGRDPRRFSKLGDSIVDTEQFFTRFDVAGGYALGGYGYLQPVIDHFAGSFGRLGAAVRNGINTWVVFDPLWANKELCRPAEDMLRCEFRLHNPSVLLVMLGTNDPGGNFEENIAAIVDFCLAEGVIPVLVTKANRIEGESNYYNRTIRRVAAEYQVPLWDFDRVAETLEGRGLDIDNVHMITFSESDYGLSYATYAGYGALNLTGLMMLDALWREGMDNN